MSRILPFIFSFFVFQSSIAQDGVSSAEFLQNQHDRLQSEVMSDLYEEIEGENFRAAFIDDVQFRTETDEFEFRRQQYRLRISPSTIQLKRTQERLYQAYKSLYLQDILELEEEVYLTACEAWIEHFITTKEIAAIKSTLEVKKLVLKDIIAQSEGGKYQIADHFRIKRSISNTEMDIQKKSEEIALLEREHAELKSVSYEGMKSITDIKSAMQTIDLSADVEAESPEKLVAEYELQEAIDEKNKVFDYLQGSYSGPHDDNFGEKYSLEFGFRLPLAGENKLEISERRMQYRLAEAERQLELRILLIESRRQWAIVQSSINRYEKKSEFQEKEYLLHDKLKENWLESGGSLDEYLEMEEIQLSNILDRIEAEEEVWETYLDYLETGKYLQRRPLLDYIGKEESVINR